MSERVEIKSRVSEIISEETQAVDLIERQIGDEEIKKFPDACSFLIDSRRVLNDQVTLLREHLEEIGGEAASGLKAAVVNAVGTAVSIMQPARNTTISAALREDHASLSALCLSYEMLHTSALTTHNYSTAALALRQLEELASLAMACSKAIPGVLISELLAQDETLDGDVAEEAEQNIHKAWKLGARLESERENHRQFAASI